MSTRILLAVLILTNPICCQMFGSAGEVYRSEPVSSDNDCCGHCQDQELPATPADDRNNTPHKPCECPNCELCQCVCAGAVMEDSVTIAVPDEIFPFQLIAGDKAPSESLAFHLNIAHKTQTPCDTINVGRTARVLFSSLLL